MTKELNIIICDPFENCFKRIIEIVREEQLIKLCLKSKVSELIRNQTENGLELERLIFSGEKISINKSLELWRKTIIESELEKVYIQNFKIEQIKSLLAIFEENNYAMKNGWYLKKKSVNLSNKEEEKMKSIKKTDGNKGVKYVLEDKFNWMNRNQELYKSLIPFFNWTLIEIDWKNVKHLYMYDRNSIKELKIVVIISNLGEGKYLTKDVFTQEEIKLKLRGMRRIHHRTDLGKGKVVYVAINEFTDCYSRYIHSWRDLTRLDSNSNLISNKSKLDEDFEKLNVANNLVKPEIIGL